MSIPLLYSYKFSLSAKEVEEHNVTNPEHRQLILRLVEQMIHIDAMPSRISRAQQEQWLADKGVASETLAPHDRVFIHWDSRTLTQTYDSPIGPPRPTPPAMSLGNRWRMAKLEAMDLELEVKLSMVVHDLKMQTIDIDEVRGY